MKASGRGLLPWGFRIHGGNLLERCGASYKTCLSAGGAIRQPVYILVAFSYFLDKFHIPGSVDSQKNLLKQASLSKKNGLCEFSMFL